MKRRSLSDEELKEFEGIDDEKFAQAVSDVIKRLDAFQFHLKMIEDTDDREVAGICLDAAEEIFPGTKERIRIRKSGVYRDVADKCIAFGLL